MTIKILVLKSGEDVIADIKEMMTPDNKVMGYLLTKPCVVKLMSAAPLTAEEDMKTTFNMGIGYCLVVPPEVAVDVELRIYGHGFKSWTIGEVVV